MRKRAERRFDNELRALVQFLLKDPIASRLRITFEKPDGDPSTKMLVSTSSNGKLLCPYDIKKCSDTNLAGVKAALIDKYEQEELDDVLTRIENIRYLFE